MIRVFGCRAMVKISDSKRKKLDKKSFECVFVGYADNTKGYRLLNIKTKQLVVSRDVVFFLKMLLLRQIKKHMMIVLLIFFTKQIIKQTNQVEN